MSIHTIGRRFSLVGCGMAIAFSAGAQTTVARATVTSPPLVDVALMGTDIVLHPDRIRYRVTSDPGSYVTLLLISPRGHRKVLNPYEQALEGTKRRELIRETHTGYTPGESYIVAIATRSRLHSSNLVRQSQAAAKFVSNRFNAESSLDELLTAILPNAGDDFSVSYVSFRVLSRGLPVMFQYANRCSITSHFGSNDFINDGFYRGQLARSSFYDAYLDEDRYFDFLQEPYFASACPERLSVPRILIATLPAPATPRVPIDTAVTPIDTLAPTRTPKGPIIPDPVAPLLLNVERFGEVVGRATTPTPISPMPDLPSVQPLPVQEKREPVMPAPMAPRIDPVMPVTRGPVVEPVVREPVPQPPVPMEPRATPTPLPPATGTTPAIPPPE